MGTCNYRLLTFPLEWEKGSRFYGCAQFSVFWFRSCKLWIHNFDTPKNRSNEGRILRSRAGACSRYCKVIFRHKRHKNVTLLTKISDNKRKKTDSYKQIKLKKIGDVSKRMRKGKSKVRYISQCRPIHTKQVGTLMTLIGAQWYNCFKTINPGQLNVINDRSHFVWLY